MTLAQVSKSRCVRLVVRAFGAILIFSAAAFPAYAAPPQTPNSPAPIASPQSTPILLKPGNTLDRAMKGGETQSFIIRAKKGQFLHVEAVQIGIDVALTFFDPPGKQISFMDTLNASYGPEKLSIVAPQSGEFRLQVASGDPHAAPGQYYLSLAKPRKPGPQDLSRIAAEKELADATLLIGQPAADGPRKPLQEFQDSAKLWHQLGDSYEEGVALMSAGEVLRSDGQSQAAVDAFTAAVALFRPLDEPHILTDTLVSLGESYDQLGDHRLAIEQFSAAVLLEAKLDDPASQARLLNSLGVAYHSAGQRQQAIDSFNQALPLERQAGDRSLEAMTLTGLGRTYDDLGDKQKAVDLYTQSLAIEKQIGDRSAEATTLNNLGWALDRLGRKQDALDNYNQALALDRAAGDRDLEGTTLSNIGSVYNVLGDKQKALDFYNQALPIQVQIGDRDGQATTLANMGYLYDDLGEFQKALDYENQALALARATNSLDAQAGILNSIGKMYGQLGDPQKQLDFLNQSLALKRQIGDPVMEIATLNNLGSAYTDSGDSQKALDVFDQALALDRQVGDPQMEAALLDNLGLLYRRTGDTQKELASLQQAIVAFARAQDLLDQGGPLSLMMDYWADAGQPQTAIFFGKEAINRVQQVRSNISGFGQQEQNSFVKSKEGVFRKLAGLLMQQGRLYEAEKVLELLQDQQYFDFSRQNTRGGAVLTGPPPLTSGESDFDRQFQEISGRVTAIAGEWATLHAKSPRTPEEDQHLADLTAQLKLANDEWNQFLDKLYTSLKATGSAQQTVSQVHEDTNAIQLILQKMDPGTVALYTMVGDDQYWVIVVTPNVTVAREYPITAAELRQKLLDFRRALSNPYADSLPLAQELYKILVGPAAQDLEEAKATTLLWKLDDDLRYIPMGALHDGRRYLIEKYASAEFTPRSVVDIANKPEVRSWLGLGMGVSKAYGDFPALPSVQGELQDVIREPGSHGVVPGEVLLDDTFTAANMKKALEQNPAVVHIASHFYYAPGNETNSFLLLGGADPQGAHLTLADLHDDPSFDFSQTKLLTLSACDTAVGSTEGDGREVDGLGNVAHDKGAEAVLASLWDVNDNSTGLLMQEMYRLWTTPPATPAHPGVMPAPVSKAEALRRAQLSLLQGQPSTSAHGASPKTFAPYASPYYWAPFVLIGNPR